MPLKETFEQGRLKDGHENATKKRNQFKVLIQDVKYEKQVFLRHQHGTGCPFQKLTWCQTPHCTLHYHYWPTYSHHVFYCTTHMAAVCVNTPHPSHITQLHHGTDQACLKHITTPVINGHHTRVSLSLSSSQINAERYLTSV